jgi:hypothetical protein
MTFKLFIAVLQSANVKPCSLVQMYQLLVGFCNLCFQGTILPWSFRYQNLEQWFQKCDPRIPSIRDQFPVDPWIHFSNGYF